MSLTVHVGGFPLAAFGAVSQLKWSDLWPRGCGGCSFSWDVPARFAHGDALQGRTLDVFDGPYRTWKGTVNEVSRGEPWTVSATGWAALGDGYAAVDSTSLPTTTPREAVQEAQSRGLVWEGDSGLVNTAYTLPQPPASVSELLTMAGLTEDPVQRWRVDHNGYVTMAADPTSVSYVVIAADGFGGRDVSDYYSKVHVRFVDEDLTWADPLNRPIYNTVNASPSFNVSGKFTPREKIVDITHWGPIDKTARAQLLVNYIAASVGPQATFTGNLTVAPGEVLDLNGNPVRLASLKAGLVYRIRGNQPDPQHGSMHFALSQDLLMSEVSYDADANTATLTPMGAEPRNLDDMIANLLSAVEARLNITPADQAA